MLLYLNTSYAIANEGEKNAYLMERQNLNIWPLTKKTRGVSL